MTGSIYIKSDVTLHIEAGSRILGSLNPWDYVRDVDAKWTSLIFSIRQKNIGITGKATLLALARQGLAFIPLVLLLPGLMQLLGLAPLLGIELVQAAADCVAFLIAIPVGVSELRKLESLRSAEQL